ncbi:type VI secretion system tip protein VgrG [Deltaproteobacteria bacterium Smac51]|nr:type VI secretion system tip protein VgrG [Deltaproteobacteria bacterium Smac51]
MRLNADQGWFEIEIEGGPEFGVYSFKGREKLNEPYEFEVELVSLEADVDLVGLLGSQALLTIGDHSGGKRLVHGSIREAQQLHTANIFTHYRLCMVPRLWYLGRNKNHRIFQNKSVKDIIDQILKEQGFLAQHVSWKLKESYEAREYCVQYGESDLYFISRLCEEEGLYFYFEHQTGAHVLCFSDASGGPMAQQSDLMLFAGSGQVADTATVTRFNLKQTVHSDKASYREWNFEKPPLDLEVMKDEADQKKAPVPGGLDLENYQYPHLYQLKAPGEKYAKVQLLRQISFTRWAEGRGQAASMLPGFAFSLSHHPRADANAQWWLTEVRHHGEQPQVLEHEAPSERGFLYQNNFIVIPFETRFVPEIKHPKCRVIGQQTAIVTGPEGEEIYTDEYGRVKVEFHWDRRDLANERSSCWIRVSQGWAGGEYGTMAIPRVGHEVVVTFLEGDPDRPLVTGRVYHAENKVPYELPAEKTKTVFKSFSSPGGGGFNEMRIEDLKGQEEIYVHAEKDLNAHIKNDWKEHILNDQHRTVDNFSYTRIKGEDHLTVDLPRKVELMADDHLTVHSDSHTEVKARWLGKAGEELHLKAGEKVVIEAGSDMTVKAGGAFIRLNPGGIFTSTPFMMGSGSPGDGSGAAPLLPEAAEEVGASAVPSGVTPLTPGEDKSARNASGGGGSAAAPSPPAATAAAVQPSIPAGGAVKTLPARPGPLPDLPVPCLECLLMASRIGAAVAE